ncbi:CNT_collapsed_G0015660.mRNA.1.CDS.1 [Saccharomyces cerevisiae]|nr:CNT_collapsed_G0015660.mRNA.1.CDS.1 [Saccharomyces cerevisiae]
MSKKYNAYRVSGIGQGLTQTRTIQWFLPRGTEEGMNKKILLNINGSRKVAGILRGYDIFLNVVLDDAMEINGEDPAK